MYSNEEPDEEGLETSLLNPTTDDRALFHGEVVSSGETSNQHHTQEPTDVDALKIELEKEKMKSDAIQKQLDTVSEQLIEEQSTKEFYRAQSLIKDVEITELREQIHVLNELCLVAQMAEHAATLSVIMMDQEE